MATEPLDPLFLAHVAVFALAALACFVSLRRARAIEDPGTRRGLVAMLLTSGGWATAHVGYLVAPTPDGKTAFYMAGLIVGFAAIGPWLYFCSAYTGRSLHRDRTVRWAAVAVFLAATAVKLTNPIHRRYFTTELVTTPFPHLAVQHGLLHWLLMGLAYALATVGYFMLFELFAQVSADTKPLAALATITGLPILFDVVGVASPYLIDITYEPIGVAAFAVGVLFVHVDRFETVQLAGSRQEPVVVLNDDGRIRDYNDSARELFPELRRRDAIGQPLEELLPELPHAVESEGSILELNRGDETRYYRVTENPFASGRASLGRMFLATDVTERERYRRELERQNERLEQFASMVSHDLRNPLNVAMGWVHEVGKEDDRLAHAEAALGRMETLIEDLLALARQGQPISETEPVSLAALARRAWDLVETGEADLRIEGDLELLADRDRLQQLFENLFRNAVEHGRPDVTVTVGPLGEGGAGAGGFFVADDGPGIPEEEREDVFETGFSTAEEGTGFGLAIVSEIVEAHGWTVDAVESEAGGARFEVAGVTTTADADVDEGAGAGRSGEGEADLA